MRRTKMTRWLGFLAAASMVLTACGGTDDSENAEQGAETGAVDGAEEDATAGGDEATAGEEGRSIGVSLPSATTTLYVEMAAGMEALAEEIGVEVVVVYAEEDAAQQVDDVNTLLTRGVDGILISPIDPDASQPAYEAARAQDVPIMSIARSTDPELQESFIGANWEVFGADIAEWTCDAVGGEGQVAMLRGPAGASFVEEMDTGYKGYMADECPDIEIVFETNIVPMTAEQALPVAEDALSAHPNLVAIYNQQDDIAKGTITVLQEQGRLDEVIVTGFDGSPGALDLVRSGELDMTVALQPFKWGQLGLNTILDHLDGEEVDDQVEIETTMVDGETIEQYDNEELR